MARRMSRRKRDETYEKYAFLVPGAARRVWKYHKEELSARGVELDDLVMDARVELLRIVRLLDGGTEEQRRGFVVTCLRNCLLRQVDLKMRRERPVVRCDLSVRAEEIAEKTPELSQLDLDSLISTLREGDQDVALLLMEGMTAEDVAATLRISEYKVGVSKDRIARAIERQRKS